MRLEVSPCGFDAPGFLSLCSRKFSSMGMPNARVLPEPVEAFPITSWPARISAMAADWIGVGRENPSLDKEMSVSAEISSSYQAETVDYIRLKLVWGAVGIVHTVCSF